MPRERAIKTSKSAKKIADKGAAGKEAAAKRKAVLAKQALGVKKAHRFRPGTTAKRLAKKEQKLSSTKTIVRRAPFGRIVRALAAKSASQLAHVAANKSNINLQAMRFSADSIEKLQQGAEHYMIDIMKSAALASKQAKRSTLMGKDIELIRAAKHELVDAKYEEDLANRTHAAGGLRRAAKSKAGAARRSGVTKSLSEEIGKSAVKRSALRVNALRLDKSAYETYHRVMLAKLSKAVGIAMAGAVHAGRQTIQAKDAELGLRLAGIKLLA